MIAWAGMMLSNVGVVNPGDTGLLLILARYALPEIVIGSTDRHFYQGTQSTVVSGRRK
jgi:hypothetical protein